MSMYFPAYEYDRMIEEDEREVHIHVLRCVDGVEEILDADYEDEDDED